MTVVESPAASTPFEREIKDLQLNKRRSTHPFFKLLMAGKATTEQRKVHAVQWYFHTVVFPNALANLLSRCKIPQMRAALSEGLYEEYTGLITHTKAHLELYFDYTNTLGITREFLEQHAYMTPGTGSLVNWYLYSTSQLDPVVGIASLAVTAEGQNINLPGDPGASGIMGKVLRERYGYTDEGLGFWDVHDGADEEHSGAGLKLVVKYAESDAQKEMVRAAIRHTQDCIWATFTDVQACSWADVTRNNCSLFY
jgi:pyrroloquinoline quinone (PQQ) biosynthesis protein C